MSTATMERPIITVSILLLLASIWIFCRPYQGFIRDSKLYALQAFSHLHADIFSTDIFLKYESQKNYYTAYDVRPEGNQRTRVNTSFLRELSVN